MHENNRHSAFTAVAIFATIAISSFILVAIWVFNAARNPETQAPSLYPAVDWSQIEDSGETMAIDWMVIPFFPTGKVGSKGELAIERAFNVEIQPMFLDANGYQKRRPLMFAAGQIPDVFWTGDSLPLRALIQHGYVLPIPYELLLRYAPNYVRAINQSAPRSWLYSNMDSQNYGIPTFSYRHGFYHPSVWRLDWLQAVGFNEPPKTLDEMEAVFRAFREDDPDGNGEKDTYGLCPNGQYWFNAFSEIFGAYGVIPYNWMERDGAIVYGGILPETRQALERLQKWYRNDWIDPDFLTVPSNGNEQKLISGKTGYLRAYGEYFQMDLSQSGSLYSRLKVLNPSAELVPGHPVVGPHGNQGSFSWGTPNHILSFGIHLSEQPEKVIRVLKMVDAMAEDEAFFLSVMAGPRGETWEHTESAGIELLPAYDELNGAELKAELLSTKITHLAHPILSIGTQLPTIRKYLSQSERQYFEKYCNPSWCMVDVFGKADVVPTSERYMHNLRRYQMTTFSEIIKGERSIDYFDTFVERWKELGGAQLTIEARELRETQLNIYQEVGHARRSAQAESLANSIY